MIDKKTLREKNKIIRKNLYLKGKIDVASKVITEKIKNNPIFIKAKNVLLFYPLKEEIDLLPLLNIKNKNFYLPRCIENNLEMCKFNSKYELKKNKYGIYEPTCEQTNPEILDLIFLPALGADNFGNRIGYGKGYYDRFLSNKDIKAKKVLVIESALISDDEIKADKFDIKYDILVSN